MLLNIEADLEAGQKNSGYQAAVATDKKFKKEETPAMGRMERLPMAGHERT